MPEPRPCTGSPAAVPDSVAMMRLSKPLEAQPSNPWTVTGSMPFIVFFWVFKCELRLLVFVLGAGRAPEPPHGARGRSGVPLAFCATLAHPFRSEGGVCLPSPLECEPGSLGLGKVAGRAPEPLAQSEREISGFPIFFDGRHASFSFKRRGLFAEPPRV